MENIKNMTPKLIKELGMRFPTELSKQRSRYGLYECPYCENTFECRISSVNMGYTKSCGCLKGGNTPGLHNNKFYKTWNDMIRRCTNHKATGYKNYGGRGITVCEEWLDVANFVAWAEKTHPNTEGMSLDRIDNDKGYSPENCRWADRVTQGVNRRKMRTNTSGFVGVYWDKKTNKWRSSIVVDKKYKHIKMCETKEEAVQARDNYIIENGLPHKLSILNTGL